MIPGWMAHEMRVMLRAFQRFGMVPGVDAGAIVEGIIGNPLRSYRAFAKDVGGLAMTSRDNSAVRRARRLLTRERRSA